MDQIVSSLSEEELNQIGVFSSNALAEAKRELGKPVDVSYMGLMRQLRDPSVRRGLVLTLRIMQVIGNQAVSEAKPG